MTKAQKTASIVAAVAVVLAAAAKLINGEAPNMTEVMLAFSTIAAAFGFQKS